ncbi:MAG: hypothetical protein COB15_08580 [Flavobacteriales bacterium]|nr:MAG: hypothetical protein COB15_08580 [Flavobacteriales bacterium]
MMMRMYLVILFAIIFGNETIGQGSNKMREQIVGSWKFDKIYTPDNEEMKDLPKILFETIWEYENNSIFSEYKLKLNGEGFSKKSGYWYFKKDDSIVQIDHHGKEFNIIIESISDNEVKLKCKNRVIKLLRFDKRLN